MAEVIRILDYLDLPPELHGLQNFYWAKRREWEDLDYALHKVAHSMLAEIKEKDE